jgi:S1-C subfamily serine protease
MRAGCLLAAALLLLAPRAQAQTALADTAALFASQRAIQDIVRRVEPAVVNVRRFVRDEKWWESAQAKAVRVVPGWVQVPERDLLYPHHRPLAGASGVVVSADGYILTLNRVLLTSTGDEADIIDVELGKDHYRAKIVAREPTIDLGILKVTVDRPLEFVPLGNSRALEQGSFVFAFGWPEGVVRTIQPGVVAQSPDRECYQDELSATYLQTSMTFAGGSLGGPVVDASGQLVAIASQRGDGSAKAAPAGGPGYALPISVASAIYESLLARQTRESPWIGVSVLRMSREARRAAGAPDSIGIKIDNVFAPSPAATLGIRIGDVIVGMQGEDVHTVYDFQRILYAAGVGQEITLDLVRKGTRSHHSIHIEKRPPEAITR